MSLTPFHLNLKKIHNGVIVVFTFWHPPYQVSNNFSEKKRKITKEKKKKREKPDLMSLRKAM